MADKYPTIQQHQPLRTPSGWDKQERTLVMQLDETFDDIYRRFGRLKLSDMGTELKNWFSDADGNFSKIDQDINQITLEVANQEHIFSEIGITAEGISLQGGKYIDINANSELNVKSNGSLLIQSSGKLDIQSLAELNLLSGGTINIATGGILSMQNGNFMIDQMGNVKMNGTLDTPYWTFDNNGATYKRSFNNQEYNMRLGPFQGVLDLRDLGGLTYSMTQDANTGDIFGQVMMMSNAYDATAQAYKHAGYVMLQMEDMTHGAFYPVSQQVGGLTLGNRFYLWHNAYIENIIATDNSLKFFPREQYATSGNYWFMDTDNTTVYFDMALPSSGAKKASIGQQSHYIEEAYLDKLYNKKLVSVDLLKFCSRNNTTDYWFIDRAGTTVYFDMYTPGTTKASIGQKSHPIDEAYFGETETDKLLHEAAAANKPDKQAMASLGQKIDNITPYGYDYVSGSPTRYGLTYEDVVQQIPEICEITDLGSGNYYKTINYMDLITILLKEVQSLRARVSALGG